MNTVLAIFNLTKDGVCLDDNYKHVVHDLQFLDFLIQTQNRNKEALESIEVVNGQITRKKLAFLTHNIIATSRATPAPSSSTTIPSVATVFAIINRHKLELEYSNYELN